MYPWLVWGQAVGNHHNVQEKDSSATRRIPWRWHGLCNCCSYKLDGVGVNAPILACNNMSSPLAVSTGQEFQIWFGRDLHNCGESNNSGKMSVDVFAWYAWIGVLYGKVLVSKSLRKKAIFLSHFFNLSLWRYSEIQETIKTHHILPYDIMPYRGIACHTLPIATYRVTGRTGTFKSFQWPWNVNII